MSFDSAAAAHAAGEQERQGDGGKRFGDAERLAEGLSPVVGQSSQPVVATGTGRVLVEALAGSAVAINSASRHEGLGCSSSGTRSIKSSDDQI